MQVLTAPPRHELNETDVRNLLTGPLVTVTAGLELLDLDLAVVEDGDLSDVLEGGTIHRSMHAKVHGTCKLRVATALRWGADLVRPYMVLDDGTTSARFDLGVYVLTTPEHEVGESPVTYNVQGFDRVHLLDREVGETYTVTADGSYTYGEALEDVFAAAGLSGVQIDGAAYDYVVPTTRTWSLVARSTDPDQTETPVTWLRIVNDLLTAINFRGVWADESGVFRCQRYAAPADRAVEWSFDTTSPARILGEERTVIADVWKTPNRWRFIWSNRPGGEQEVEGDGLYTVENLTDGPTSQSERGLVWTKVYRFEAASQAVLEALGNRQVAADRSIVTTVKATTGPFPVAGHFDVFELDDPEVADVSKVQAIEWEFDVLGGDVSWTWEAVS